MTKYMFKTGDRIRIRSGMTPSGRSWTAEDPARVYTVDSMSVAGNFVYLLDGPSGGWAVWRFCLAETDAALTLDPNDPFESALINIVKTNRKKRHDYTADGASPWQNFDQTENEIGAPHGTAVRVLIETKRSRLRALATRPDGPVNESVADTKLDLAVYHIIDYARDLYPDGTVSR